MSHWIDPVHGLGPSFTAGRLCVWHRGPSTRTCSKQPAVSGIWDIAWDINTLEHGIVIAGDWHSHIPIPARAPLDEQTAEEKKPRTSFGEDRLPPSALFILNLSRPPIHRCSRQSGPPPSDPLHTPNLHSADHPLHHPKNPPSYCATLRTTTCACYIGSTYCVETSNRYPPTGAAEPEPLGLAHQPRRLSKKGTDQPTLGPRALGLAPPPPPPPPPPPLLAGTTPYVPVGRQKVPGYPRYLWWSPGLSVARPCRPAVH